MNHKNKLLMVSKYIYKHYKIGQPEYLFLQHLIYFVSLEYLKENQSPLFKEKYEAWIYGATCPKLFNFFKKNWLDFSSIEDINDKKLIDFLDHIIPKYLHLDIETLIILNMSSTPYLNARENLDYNEISTKKIKTNDMLNYANEIDFEKLVTKLD